MKTISYKILESACIDEVLEFWKHTPGVHLHENGEDTKEGIEAYLLRNPNCSFIARDNNEIVGAILCGHDGRRGFVNHLGVSVTHRRSGIATHLLELVQNAFVHNNIKKGALFVLNDNDAAQLFYKTVGWNEEDIVKIFCKVF